MKRAGTFRKFLSKMNPKDRVASVEPLDVGDWVKCGDDTGLIVSVGREFVSMLVCNRLRFDHVRDAVHHVPPFVVVVLKSHIEKLR